MSNAVLLEGFVHQNAEEGGNSSSDMLWKGHWRFMKDKKGILQFNYTKIGYEVPKDLLEYVSFMDPASLYSSSHQYKSSSSSKSKKRGRGRPPLAPITPTSSNPAQGFSSSVDPLSNASLTSPEAALDQSKDNGEDGAGDAMEVDGPGITQQDTKDDGNGMDGYQLLNLEAPSMDICDQNLLEDNNPPPSDEPIIIPNCHPLAGVWKGNFSVTTAKGEERIDEIIFFHSMLGAEPKNRFKDLPPEPQFPYTLLKRIEPVKNPNETTTISTSSVENQNLQDTTKSEQQQIPSTEGVSNIQTENPAINTNNEQRLNESSQQLTVKIEGNSSESSSSALKNDPPSEAPTESVPVVVKSEAPIGANTTQSTAPAYLEVDPDSIQDDAAASLAFGYSPALLEALYKKVLIGFGKNALGRFSLAALYDEATGEFRCEKKYMTVKYAVKRGRRSHAEYALSYASSTTTTTAAPVSAAPTPSHANQTNNNNTAAGTQASTTVTRKNSMSSINNEPVGIMPARSRSSNKLLTQYLEDEINLENAQKRKRAGSLKPKTPNNGNKALRDPWLEASFQSNPNALVGFRNPDNDDPNISYREAFQDCDTGEIYEGGWAFNTKHGKGICLYADGLLYEGNWHRGKEHGKGKLMTGDRRVIYNGDWLDGLIHGTGVYNFGNGDRYTGDWKEGNRHGKGEYITATGCIYVGDWKDNKRHGKGKFIWPDGSYYEGDWELDTRHGRGILELDNGFRYDGYWSHNVMEGKGTCTFPSGQSYQGTYKGGLRDGRGSVQFAEGPTYEGRFKEDRFDGQGTLKMTNNVFGLDDTEVLIPIQIQSDFSRIHWKAGFGANAH